MSKRARRYAHYLVRRRYDGSWEWALIQGSRTLACSSSCFASKRRALDAVKLARSYAGRAEITEEAT